MDERSSASLDSKSCSPVATRQDIEQKSSSGRKLASEELFSTPFQNSSEYTPGTLCGKKCFYLLYWLELFFTFMNI